MIRGVSSIISSWFLSKKGRKDKNKNSVSLHRTHSLTKHKTWANMAFLWTIQAVNQSQWQKREDLASLIFSISLFPLSNRERNDRTSYKLILYRASFYPWHYDNMPRLTAHANLISDIQSKWLSLKIDPTPNFACITCAFYNFCAALTINEDIPHPGLYALVATRMFI